MEMITLGIVSAPGLASDLAHKIQNRLEKELQERTENGAGWQIEVKVDELTGATDQVKKITAQANYWRKFYEWDYVLSLTDLPIVYEKHIVVGDIDLDEKSAQISLPAYGMIPTAKKVEASIADIIIRLYWDSRDREKRPKGRVGGGTSWIERRPIEKENGRQIERFIVRSRIAGLLKVLSGLTIANQPWKLISSFKKMIGVAFATGTYMLLFNTLWNLSGAYGLLRLVSLSVFSIAVMVVWIIVVHNLWEKKRAAYGTESLRDLYNAATVSTIAFSVIFYYGCLFLLFLIAVALFVPPHLFGETLKTAPRIADYLKLAWLVSSTATVAGAIGVSLEQEDAVKRSAYGYRQYMRSKKAEELEEQAEQEDDRGGEEERKENYKG